MKNLKNRKIRLDGERIFLKTLSKKNATREYCNWLNDPEVNRYLTTKSATIAEIKKYIEEKNKNPNCLFLGIFFKENQKPCTGNSVSVQGKHIGNIKLEPIDFKNLKATTGILIGDKNYWGKGLATEATKLLVNYAFQKLNLKEINLVVIPENKTAIRVYEKVGFKFDHFKKKAVKHHGKLLDTIIMSIKI